MRRFYGCHRATYRCSDQAPFSTGSPGRLRCRSLFIADRPTLPQAVATAPLATAQFSSGRAFCPPIWHPPTDPLPLYHHDLHPRAHFYPNVLPSDVPSHGLTPGHRRIKTHSSFVPNRRGFLHRTVSKPPRPRLCVALQPISSRGRGASDTVLGIIGSHVDVPSGAD